MRNRILTMVAVATSLIVTAGYAQSSRELQGNIPFSFRVGQKQLSAGTYTIKTISQGVVMVRSLDCKDVAMVLTNAVQAHRAPAEGKLVFQRYGNAYFLSQVWRPGDDAGMQVPNSKAEREMRREAARHGQPPALAAVGVSGR